MKLHSDILTESDIREALETARRKGHVVGGISVTTLDRQGSRKRSTGFEVRISSSYADGIHKRRTMDGANYAATWHEWGYFIVELFRKDDELVFGPYADFETFHERTRYQFPY